MVVTKEDIDSIEWRTRDQGASDLWKEERMRRHLMEDVAMEYEMKQVENGSLGLIIKRSGLVISEDNPWLAASPDGIVTDPTAPQ